MLTMWGLALAFTTPLHFALLCYAFAVRCCFALI